jgi:hypothetical protein
MSIVFLSVDIFKLACFAMSNMSLLIILSRHVVGDGSFKLAANDWALRRWRIESTSLSPGTKLS